uniref:Flexible cuticle protein 12 n=1 Tax=Hyalophora cecropia TaxID=7123 RepID=CU12_HYACE|nr:RecName: Full=Flexible cuticle protein 12; Flags: Precursor [Hyalophora cecropia]AAA85640.1 cuticle protein 12 [Hyalophora cecropia]
MKSFVVVALLVAVAAAVPLTPDGDAQILKYENDNIGVEGFQYGYETSNGIQHQESGQLNNVGTENEGIEVRGQFSYVGPDGVTYSVTYTAGQEGFKPVGAHIPVA